MASNYLYLIYITLNWKVFTWWNKNIFNFYAREAKLVFCKIILENLKKKYLFLTKILTEYVKEFIIYRLKFSWISLQTALKIKKIF